MASSTSAIRIIGIDPGLRHTGWGVIETDRVRLTYVASGTVSSQAGAALPAALFGLGGVLVRYRPEGDMKIVALVAAASLILHPTITFTLGNLLSLSTGQLRSAVLSASMAPGVNTYVFANMYGVGKRVAATLVLVATGLSILSIWVWLAILDHTLG